MYLLSQHFTYMKYKCKKKKILYHNSQDMCHSFDKFVGKQIIKILEVRIECFS